MKKYDVFISYSRKDDEMGGSESFSPIGQILHRFKEEGIKSWIDREGKYCGSAFQPIIVRAIDNSELMLFVSSANSNSEDAFWVRCEVNYAVERRMKILPLLLDGTPIHEAIKLIFSGKDKNEYYKNPSQGLDNLIGSIKKHFDEIRRREEKEEEQKRIEKLEKEIVLIKKRIADYVEKQQSCLKNLLLKEKELKKREENKNCPVCQTPIGNLEVDFCEICGWHFSTPKEFASLEMQRLYDERLFVSQAIWMEREQCRKEIGILKKERNDLTTQIKSLLKEEHSYNGCTVDFNIHEISKLRNEQNRVKSQLADSVEFSKGDNLGRQPVAFLLVTELDQTNVYCLFEGRNIFGSKQCCLSMLDYQMIVVSEDCLCPQHFEIYVEKKNNNKNYSFTVFPCNDRCIIALNNRDNIIRKRECIQINDLLLVGHVEMKIVDNFNKNNYESVD